ncbi:GGDEF domain-containing protein [Sulfurimonas sp. SAG-AH-194-I05]|nr:GGDEF domain-containing protein [Sulfurimonas sp. SAG-AH-194-I05]MDF1875685.1 GGDEF domain-containing protein [Sulfurimonas sp. SAG-AH-194-I05]
MKKFITRFGIFLFILIITFISISIVFIFYLCFAKFAHSAITELGMILSVAIPFVIVPFITYRIIRLIFKVHELEAYIEKIEVTDSLTGIMNRKAFLAASKKIYQISKRDKLTIGIVYIDIDDFKKINDNFGNFIADELLKSFVHELEKIKRESDLIGRVGGEEFVFLLSNTNLEGSVQFANKVQEIIHKNVFTYEYTNIAYTVSLGVSALSQDNTVDLEELISQADKALVVAKEAGKDSVYSYQL